MARIAIAAMARNRVIGKDNKLPWPRQQADMDWFRQVTHGKTVVMGKNTWQSVGALPGRQCLVVTSDIQVPNATTIANLPEDYVCIGGAQLYKELLPKCHYLYLTVFNFEAEGDTLMPEHHGFILANVLPIANGEIQIWQNTAI